MNGWVWAWLAAVTAAGLTRWLTREDDDLLFPVGVGAVVLLVGASIVSTTRSAAAWEAFRVEHHCVVIGHMSGDTAVGTGVGAKGEVVTTVTSTAGKTGYKCDDGLEYWQ